MIHQPHLNPQANPPCNLPNPPRIQLPIHYGVKLTLKHSRRKGYVGEFTLAFLVFLFSILLTSFYPFIASSFLPFKCLILTVSPLFLPSISCSFSPLFYSFPLLFMFQSWHSSYSPSSLFFRSYFVFLTLFLLFFFLFWRSALAVIHLSSAFHILFLLPFSSSFLSSFVLVKYPSIRSTARKPFAPLCRESAKCVKVEGPSGVSGVRLK